MTEQQCLNDILVNVSSHYVPDSVVAITSMGPRISLPSPIQKSIQCTVKLENLHDATIGFIRYWFDFESTRCRDIGHYKGCYPLNFGQQLYVHTDRIHGEFIFNAMYISPEYSYYRSSIDDTQNIRTDILETEIFDKDLFEI